MMKPKLTIPVLIEEARTFCKVESSYSNPDLFGVTDGKAIGTYIERKFQEQLQEYDYLQGSSAKGIDLPSETINTDIKVTSIRQPQSSCPFRSPRQKIYGLGYNLLLFVYDKNDDLDASAAQLTFTSCTFIHAHRTGDYTMTRILRQLIANDANREDIIGCLTDRNIPADDITLNALAEDILRHPPEQGYLTISNALQWRLQYSRVVSLTEVVDGIDQIMQVL